jgi:hypothetical protein
MASMADHLDPPHSRSIAVVVISDNGKPSSASPSDALAGERPPGPTPAPTMFSGPPEGTGLVLIM